MKSNPKTLMARRLRHEQTSAENRLWAELLKFRADGIKYRRQHPIGDFIVDFICLEKRLIIEIDGGQHNLESERQKDNYRTEWLESEGYKVIRFWNNDVLTNIDGVIAQILIEH